MVRVAETSIFIREIPYNDWCSRYLYFNLEESVLRIEIFTKLEKQHFDAERLEYLIKMLKEYPQAYQYKLEDGDNRQQWALRKKFNFQKRSGGNLANPH